MAYWHGTKNIRNKFYTIWYSLRWSISSGTTYFEHEMCPF
jgi:hypothetical protein